jgi:glycosyltransferase involved in cell wall biosynthesis
MRVAILLSDLTANGGAPRQAMQLALGLQNLGHDATLYAVRYCPENCYPEIAKSITIRAVERLSLGALRHRHTRRRHGIVDGARRHFWECRQLIRLLREPHDLLNPHVRGATRAAVACKRRSGAPVVWMCDDARNWEQAGYRRCHSQVVQWAADRFMTRIELPVVREIDRIVALDTRVKTILEDFYHRPAHVVRSGVDLAEFRSRPEMREEIRARHGIGSADFLLLWLGILEPHRRLEDVLEALRLLQMRGWTSVRFVIAGSAAGAPAYAKKLEDLAKSHALRSWVRFHFVPVAEREMAGYYSAADALVYLAENQCWGLGVFEAIACNLPVIVSRACGAHEVLEHRRTAMLAPPRDPNALADAIAELARDPALARSMTRTARWSVLQRLTWETYTENMLRIFERVIAERARESSRARREVFV